MVFYPFTAYLWILFRLLFGSLASEYNSGIKAPLFDDNDGFQNFCNQPDHSTSNVGLRCYGNIAKPQKYSIKHGLLRAKPWLFR